MSWRCDTRRAEFFHIRPWRGCPIWHSSPPQPRHGSHTWRAHAAIVAKVALIPASFPHHLDGVGKAMLLSE